MNLRYNDNVAWTRRVNYFSNPDVNYEGVPTGNASYADNARLIDERRFIGDKNIDVMLF